MQQRPSAQQIRKSLFSIPASTIKYDLSRIQKAADRLGNPHNCYKTFHVAGTNGKGSTCAYIESILRRGGIRTGLFTSPHLVDFEERFRINGAVIAEKEWLPVYDDLRGIIADLKLTFFEATMLIAIELFKRKNVECAVFETGLGGRLDATNIILPEVSVITKIAIDHKEYLGDTLEMIAKEKLGIVKNHTPLVMVDPVDEGIRALAQRICDSKGSEGVFITDAMVASLQETPSENCFVYKGTAYSSKMAGRFQVMNAACAIESVMRSCFCLSEELYRCGITDMWLPGRFQQMVVLGKTVIVDVGHNPDAVEAFCATLQSRFAQKKICMVVGIMSDKDFYGMIAHYAIVASHIVFTSPKTNRAASAEMLGTLLPVKRRTICPDVEQAIETAFNRNEDVVVVTGSFYTAGEAMNYFNHIMSDKQVLP